MNAPVYPRLLGFLFALALGALLLATGCASERYAPAIDAKVDSALVAAGVPPLSVRRLKFTGPVTFQIGGTGNVATAIGKAKAPVASAPHATATKTSAGVPWWVYAGLAALAAAGGFVLRGKLKFPLPF